ncbi:MAG: hypothetical protein U0670_08685 [Anaerolineae bacterium]
MRQAGQITYNDRWILTPARKLAIARLAELGVDISSSADQANFVLMIPFDLPAPDYVEIGYLMAQLGDENFPVDYFYLSFNIASNVIPPKPKSGLPVEFADSYPHAMKFRVNPSRT